MYRNGAVSRCQPGSDDPGRTPTSAGPRWSETRTAAVRPTLARTSAIVAYGRTSARIPGIAPETRPYATGVLVTTSVVVTILWGANVIGFRNLGVVTGPIQNDWWRLLSTTFIHDNVGVIFATMLATAIFGTHLERRFGPALVVGTFLLGGAAGAALAVAFKDFPAVGANASALALLVAWLVDDRLAAQRGEERGNDMIGVVVIAAVLLALPLADTNVSWAASIGGIGLGAAVGALISPLRR